MSFVKQTINILSFICLLKQIIDIQYFMSFENKRSIFFLFVSFLKQTFHNLAHMYFKNYWYTIFHVSEFVFHKIWLCWQNFQFAIVYCLELFFSILIEFNCILFMFIYFDFCRYIMLPNLPVSITYCYCSALVLIYVALLAPQSGAHRDLISIQPTQSHPSTYSSRAEKRQT